MLTISMVGQLVLQTKIQQQGFTLADLQTENYELNAQQALLQASVDKQSTPVQLAFSASNLGMVANPYSNLLVLPSGEIIGFSKKVRGNEARIVSATPTLPTRQVDDTPGLDTSQVNTPVPTEPGQATPNLHLSQGG
ncbi:MAG: hypothetical protein FWG15_05810 [Propionibacteriaceae bacterium]|jgi:hypothetical protein|nr:hypothetical protein [Propionibacteriaceae bacterium]